MALAIGTVNADSGMSKAIFDQLNVLLAPPLEHAVDQATEEQKPGAQKALEEARDGWRKLSFAIATGVIGHLLSNMEIVGVQTTGDVAASVSGATGPSAPAAHVHTVTLTANQSQLTFRQSNDGTGRVK